MHMQSKELGMIQVLITFPFQLIILKNFSFSSKDMLEVGNGGMTHNEY